MNWGLGFRVWGLGFKVWGLGFRFGVWGLGFRVLWQTPPHMGREAAAASVSGKQQRGQGDLGFRHQGLGFGVWGLGFRV